MKKCEKRNVNGAGDVRRVLWKFLTAAGFDSMCCLRTKNRFGRKTVRALRGWYLDADERTKKNCYKTIRRKTKTRRPPFPSQTCEKNTFCVWVPKTKSAKSIENSCVFWVMRVCTKQWLCLGPFRHRRVTKVKRCVSSEMFTKNKQSESMRIHVFLESQEKTN